jgi:hypothetical protein
VFVTPWQIIRNIAGLVNNRDQPSKDLAGAIGFLADGGKSFGGLTVVRSPRAAKHHIQR